MCEGGRRGGGAEGTSGRWGRMAEAASVRFMCEEVGGGLYVFVRRGGFTVVVEQSQRLIVFGVCRHSVKDDFCQVCVVDVIELQKDSSPGMVQSKHASACGPAAAPIITLRISLYMCRCPMCMCCLAATRRPQAGQPPSILPLNITNCPLPKAASKAPGGADAAAAPAQAQAVGAGTALGPLAMALHTAVGALVPQCVCLPLSVQACNR